MIQSFFVSEASSPALYTRLPLDSVFLTKITRQVEVKHNLSESNTFLIGKITMQMKVKHELGISNIFLIDKRAHLTLTPVLF